MIPLYKCQQILIKPDQSLKAILAFIRSESHKLTNCGIYYARQIFFKTGKIIKKFTHNLTFWYYTIIILIKVVILLYKCQQILIKPDQSLKAILEFICSESHKLANCGIYYGRQIFFKTGKIINKFDLINEYKHNKHYQVLYSQAAQQTLLSVFESFKSFKSLNSKYRKGELLDKPRLPKYRKTGLAPVSYPKQALKLVEGKIQIPLGQTINRWFQLKNFLLPMPSNLSFNEIKELRILPRNRCFYIEFVYQTSTSDVEKQQLNQDRCLGIDTGINNWLTCVSNIGTSFIIDGKHLKSVNQWFNKQIANIKQNKPQGFWSYRLAAITEKRNRQINA